MDASVVYSFSLNIQGGFDKSLQWLILKRKYINFYVRIHQRITNIQTNAMNYEVLCYKNNMNFHTEKKDQFDSSMWKSVFDRIK